MPDPSAMAEVAVQPLKSPRWLTELLIICGRIHADVLRREYVAIAIAPMW